jgi:ubiquinone/menaquinone biosynthesis C-methylase UbiE
VCDERQRRVAEYWGRQAGEYDEQFDHEVGSAAEAAAWERVLDAVTGRGQGERLAVLDVGTGTGFLALLLAARGHVVTGIDLAQEMLERARGKAAAQGLAAAFEVGDAERPAFADEGFDLVISRHVFWALEDKPGVLARWGRLLRAGGCVAIVDGDWCAGSDDSPSADEVRGMVEAAGFGDVRVDGLGDLSTALEKRAAREGYALPGFERYVVWGYWGG